MLTLPELGGLWRRSLIRWPDGRSDTTTQVHWLQGPTLYADLRQPRGLHWPATVRCLRELGREHLQALAVQEGFAGVLQPAGDCVEWQRQIDFQPFSGHADAGRLHMADGILIEEGRDQPYVEHWHRSPEASGPPAAAALGQIHGSRRAILVRAGALFMFARSRGFAVPPAPGLASLLAATPDLRAAQDLLDCEISIGTVSGTQWRIDRSTLPWRQGALLAPALVEDGGGLESADVAAEDGAPLRLRWKLTHLEGTLPVLLAPAPAVS